MHGPVTGVALVDRTPDVADQALIEKRLAQHMAHAGGRGLSADVFVGIAGNQDDGRPKYPGFAGGLARSMPFMFGIL